MIRSLNEKDRMIEKRELYQFTYRDFFTVINFY
jgi:hypothetical protein